METSIREYHSPGKLFLEYSLDKEGYLEGVYKEYFVNGTLSRYVEYKSGTLNGQYIIYDKNGMKKSEHVYKNGMFLRDEQEIKNFLVSLRFNKNNT